MSVYDDMSNNEILMSIKKMEIEHFNLKEKMLRDWDKLLELEEHAKIAANIMSKRLKTK
jgi:hypothetical protein